MNTIEQYKDLSYLIIKDIDTLEKLKSNEYRHVGLRDVTSLSLVSKAWGMRVDEYCMMVHKKSLFERKAQQYVTEIFSVSEIDSHDMFNLMINVITKIRFNKIHELELLDLSKFLGIIQFINDDYIDSCVFWLKELSTRSDFRNYLKGSPALEKRFKDVMNVERKESTNERPKNVGVDKIPEAKQRAKTRYFFLICMFFIGCGAILFS